MHPIAFYIGSFAVHWYGVFIGIGFLVSFRLLLSLKKYAGLTTDQIYNISMIALFAGVFGARAFFVVQNWSLFSGRGLWAILNVHEGGLVFYGGFILAFTAAKEQSLVHVVLPSPVPLGLQARPQLRGNNP